MSCITDISLLTRRRRADRRRWQVAARATCAHTPTPRLLPWAVGLASRACGGQRVPCGYMGGLLWRRETRQVGSSGARGRKKVKSTFTTSKAAAKLQPLSYPAKRADGARAVDAPIPRVSTSDLRPPTSDLRPPTPDLRPPTSDLGPPTAPTSDLRPLTSNLRPPNLHKPPCVFDGAPCSFPSPLPHSPPSPYDTWQYARCA